MPKIPMSVWAKVGEYALFALDAYVAKKRGSVAVPPIPVAVEPVQPPAPVPAPAPPPVTNLRDKWYGRLDVIYMEEWGRVISDSTSDGATERYQGYVLLEAGREDELRRNLRGRK